MNPALNTLLMAHRGWQQRFPENSRAAVQAALELGAKHVEIDIQFTRDRVPVLCHDIDLERLSGEKHSLAELDYETAKELSFHEPSRLGLQHYPSPLFTLAECAECLSGYPEATLYVEVKPESLDRIGRDNALSLIAPLLSAVQSQCVIISYDIKLLHFAHDGGYRTAPVLSSWDQWQDGSFDNLGCELVVCNWQRIPEHCDVKALPYPVAVYEISNPPQANHWLSRGVVLVESFNAGDFF